MMAMIAVFQRAVLANVSNSILVSPCRATVFAAPVRLTYLCRILMANLVGYETAAQGILGDTAGVHEVQ